MRFLVALVALIIGGWSLAWPMSIPTHLTVLAICGPPVWWIDVSTRPMVPCKFCDKGRSWDAAHKHFGEFCPGGPLGIGSCGGTGKKLRPAARVARSIGLGHHLRNLPEAMRPKR